MSERKRDYEDAFARFIGADAAFTFWKGRVALYALLRALDVGKDDEVIMPGYTCVMDVNPVMYVGAKPVYVDIEPITYNLDPALLETAITPRTRVILAQHTYGYPAAMDEIMDIAGRHGIAVLEDCCLALGSTYKGKIVGTFGQAAYFSFQWNKPYTSGLGGMATTSDESLASRLRELCKNEMAPPSTAQAAMLAVQLAIYRMFIYPKTTALAANVFRALTKLGLVVGSSGTQEYAPAMAADFFRGMSTAQVRAGARQLRRVARNLAHRRRMARLYDQLLCDAGWPRVEIPDHLDPVLVRYPIRVADKKRALERAAKHLVELGSWFECPLHPIETPLEVYGYRAGMCPIAERASREVVNLPVHPRANERTARRTVDFITTIGPAEGS